MHIEFFPSKVFAFCFFYAGISWCAVQQSTHTPLLPPKMPAGYLHVLAAGLGESFNAGSTAMNTARARAALPPNFFRLAFMHVPGSSATHQLPLTKERKAALSRETINLLGLALDIGDCLAVCLPNAAQVLNKHGELTQSPMMGADWNGQQVAGWIYCGNIGFLNAFGPGITYVYLHAVETEEASEKESKRLKVSAHPPQR